MKILRLPAIVALSTVLAACSGGNEPAAEFSLTVNLAGVPAAPVSVKAGTNTLWNGTVTVAKTFTNIAGGSVVTVKGGAVPGFDMPAEQTVTVNASQGVTLTYAAQRGAAVSPTGIGGPVTGATFPAGYVLLGNADGVSLISRGTLSASGGVDLKLVDAPDGGGSSTLLPPTSAGCTFTGTSTANPTVFRFSRLYVYSAQGDSLGQIHEEITSGATVPVSVVARIYSTASSKTSGTVNCGANGSVVYELDLKAGWNAVEYSAMTAAPTVLTLKSLDPAATVRLRGELYRSYVNIELGDVPLVFAANQTVSVAATVEQVGGVSGQVTLSTDVPGLTVEPAQLTLPTLGAASQSALGQNAGLSSLELRGLGLTPQRLNTRLIFRSTGAASGTQPFQLIVKDSAGRQVGAGRGTLSVQRPGVQLDLGTSVPQEYVCQGETAAVNGRLVSLFGYAGPVTLNVGGLPAGVTALPLQVTVQANASTEFRLPVTVARDAPLTQRDVTIELSGPGATGSVSLALGVCPQRTLINNQSGVADDFVAPVSSGVWIMTGVASTQTSGQYDWVLKRFTVSGVAATVTLPQVGRLVGLRDGDVMALPFANETGQAKRVGPDGSFTTLDRPDGLGRAVSDANGRLWYIARVGDDRREVLARWNPLTGDVAVVDRTRNYSQEYGRLQVSPDGTTLLYLASGSDPLVVINTATDGLRTLNTPVGLNPFSTVALSNAGSVWFTDSTSLNRLNEDGTVSTFTSPVLDRKPIAGFDALTPGVLWLAGGGQAVRLDTVSMNTTSTTVGRVSYSVPTRSGGVAVVTYSGCSVQNCSYLTLLP